MLGNRYSANAHAFSLRYQNCNQWLVELLAVAWGDLAVGDAGREGDELRRDAQQWLQAEAYAPTLFELGNPLLLWLGGQLPWLHTDDHPADDLAAWQLRVSMPASIAAFVQRQAPATRRIEFCHNQQHIVVRHGGAPIAEGCRPGPEDTVVALAPG